MKWHELSWPQIEALDKGLPVVIPVAACEQHGRHLPLHVDSIEVQTIVDQTEPQLRDEAVFLPTLWLGSSHHHRDFPGTLSVPPSFYTELLMHLARSVLSAGFQRIFFLNGHGGNEVPISQALSELAVAAEQPLLLTFASWWALAEVSPETVGAKSPGLNHACEYETSFMMAVRPDLVQAGEIKHDYVEKRPWVTSKYGGMSRYGRRVAGSARFRWFTEDGFVGAPQSASAESGKKMIAHVSACLSDFLREFAQWPVFPNHPPPQKKGG